MSSPVKSLQQINDEMVQATIRKFINYTTPKSKVTEEVSWPKENFTSLSNFQKNRRKVDVKKPTALELFVKSQIKPDETGVEDLRKSRGKGGLINLKELDKPLEDTPGGMTPTRIKKKYKTFKEAHPSPLSAILSGITTQDEMTRGKAI